MSSDGCAKGSPPGACTALWSSTMAQGGIFATDGSSPWGGANRVYVKCAAGFQPGFPQRCSLPRASSPAQPPPDRYCSSDFWSGNAGASAATFGYSFRGSRIVAAVMQDLQQSLGLGKVPGTRLLFGGCSAGAIGAMNNIEAVAAAAPPGVEVMGFLDGAALLNIQPTAWTWSPTLLPLQSLSARPAADSSPSAPAR